MATLRSMFSLFIAVALLTVCFRVADGQTIKVTVGQAGVNPGTSLYFSAQK